jgi:hypothetical protein
MSSVQLPSSILYTRYMSYGDVFMSGDSVRNPDYVTNLAILNLSDIPTVRLSTHFFYSSVWTCFCGQYHEMENLLKVYKILPEFSVC